MFYYRDKDKPIWLEITYTPVVDQTGEQSSSIAANSYELTGLRQGTVYQIYMRSVGEKSVMSEPSETMMIRTKGESMCEGSIVKWLY